MPNNTPTTPKDPSAPSSRNNAEPSRSETDAFRRYNRFYTNYLGLLHEGLYGRELNLTEARVLYEVAQEPGCSAASIAGALRMDRGFLSRLLTRFERQGLVAQEPSEADKRIKGLVLTDEGRALMEDLAGAARAQAAQVLSGLAPTRRAKLLAAMAAIEDLLGEEG